MTPVVCCLCAGPHHALACELGAFARTGPQTPISQLRPIRHGSPGGCRAHYRRGEKPCDACHDADRERQRRYRARQSETAA